MAAIDAIVPIEAIGATCTAQAIVALPTREIVSVAPTIDKVVSTAAEHGAI